MNILFNKGELYKITNTITGKSYIGQAWCFLTNGTKRGSENRIKEHIRSASDDPKKKKTCRYLKSALKKYGVEQFVFKTIHLCEKSKLDYFETKYIRHFNTLAPNGYNLQTGGQGKGRKLSDIVRKAMSDNRKGEKKGMYGRKHSPETCEKIRKKSTGRKDTPETLEKKRTSHLGKTIANRKYFHLPQYIYHVGGGKNAEGYQVRMHPTMKERKFCSLKLTMDEKLELAKKYLGNA